MLTKAHAYAGVTRSSAILFAIAMGGALTLHATTVIWDLNTKYGVSETATNNQTQINQALTDAKGYLSRHGSDTLVLKLDPGSYTIHNEQGLTNGLLVFNNINPSGGGRLVFEGAGHSSTALIFDHYIVGQSYPTACLYGNPASHITIQGMQLTTVNMTVTQGTVVSAGSSFVVVEIPAGFPTPADIYDPNMSGGRFLRKYDNSNPLSPTIIDNTVWPPADNSQVAWVTAQQISGQQWQLNLSSSQNPYSPGDYLAIKSKHGSFSYMFQNGNDFVFDDILWTRESRGVFRNGYDNITVQNSFIQRDAAISGQAPCLATPDGGPQIGQPSDPPVTTALIQNNQFIGTGDDAVAFFNVGSGGIIQNNYLAESFARGILLYSSANAQLTGNTLVDDAVYYQ